MPYSLRFLYIQIPVAHVTCGVGVPSTTHSNSKPTLLSGKSTLPSGSILIILAGILPLYGVSDKMVRYILEFGIEIEKLFYLAEYKMPKCSTSNSFFTRDSQLNRIGDDSYTVRCCANIPSRIGWHCSRYLQNICTLK